jgi:hypothetical protein
MDGQHFDEIARKMAERKMAETSSRRGVLKGLALGGVAGLFSLLGVKSTSATHPACRLPNGCVPREKPPTNRRVAVWWADHVPTEKAKDGICKGDWVVTYNTNTSGWVNADPNRYRYYGAGWSRIGARWAKSHATALNQPPGVRLCLSGLYSYNDVRYGSYLWLK